MPDARLDAELLLAELLGLGRPALLLRRGRAADAGLARRYRAWVARRLRREPLQHITGTQQFHGLDFRVDARALIPRPETEMLIDALLGSPLAPGARLVDLGTGSGCIAVTLAVKAPDARLFAVDRAQPALELARENARRHGVEDRIEFHAVDLARTPAGWRGTMHAVVSNPPYVSEAQWERLEPEVRDHDPKQALVAGPSGLECYRELAGAAADLLAPRGTLVLELGYDQQDAVRALVERAGFSSIEIRPDLNGVPRVLLARAPGGGSR